MATTNKLITSLIGYVKDVKPYHSKLRDFTSEIFFSDEVNVAVVDGQPELQVGLRNIWTRAEDERLSRLSEGTAFDQIIDIPPMVLPRFSLNTFLNYGQTPPGNDPASLDLTDSDADGTPDSEDPYVLPPDPQGLGNHLSQSHRLGNDVSPYELRFNNVTVLSIDTLTPTGASSFDYSATMRANLSPEQVAELTAFGIPTLALNISVKNLVSPGFATGYLVLGTLVGNTVTWEVLDQVNRALLPAHFGVLDNQQVAEALAHKMVFEAFLANDTGRYKVPFHHGSYVTVDGVPQTLLTDYTVDRRRSVIQFLAGKHPAPTAKINFNLYSSDRMFVAMAAPYDYNLSGNYDMSPFEALPYDTIGGSLLSSDHYIIVIDSTSPTGYSEFTFTDVLPGKTKCTLEKFTIDGATDGDVWLATAVSEFTLAVQKISPTTGPISYAYITQPFNNGEIGFTITPPWVQYYFDLQTGSYLNEIDSVTGDLYTKSWLYDPADFYPNVDIKTQKGVYTDPLPPVHSPVLFQRVGQVKQRIDGTYFLELTDIPPRGTYIEVRVEQSQQYNPRAASGIDERLDIVVITSDPIITPVGFNGDGESDDGDEVTITLLSGSGSPAPAPTPTPTPTPTPDNILGLFCIPADTDNMFGWSPPLTDAFGAPVNDGKGYSAYYGVAGATDPIVYNGTNRTAGVVTPMVKDGQVPEGRTIRGVKPDVAGLPPTGPTYEGNKGTANSYSSMGRSQLEWASKANKYLVTFFDVVRVNGESKGTPIGVHDTGLKSAIGGATGSEVIYTISYNNNTITLHGRPLAGGPEVGWSVIGSMDVSTIDTPAPQPDASSMNRVYFNSSVTECMVWYSSGLKGIGYLTFALPSGSSEWHPVESTASQNPPFGTPWSGSGPVTFNFNYKFCAAYVGDSVAFATISGVRTHLLTLDEGPYSEFFGENTPVFTEVDVTEVITADFWGEELELANYHYHLSRHSYWTLAEDGSQRNPMPYARKVASLTSKRVYYFNGPGDPILYTYKDYDSTLVYDESYADAALEGMCASGDILCHAVKGHHLVEVIPAMRTGSCMRHRGNTVVLQEHTTPAYTATFNAQPSDYTLPPLALGSQSSFYWTFMYGEWNRTYWYPNVYSTEALMLERAFQVLHGIGTCEEARQTGPGWESLVLGNLEGSVNIRSLKGFAIFSNPAMVWTAEEFQTAPTYGYPKFPEPATCHFELNFSLWVTYCTNPSYLERYKIPLSLTPGPGRLKYLQMHGQPLAGYDG